MKIAFDFETEEIQDWPEYPPKPVGLSIWVDGGTSGRYYAFGHPTENNSTWEEAASALATLWADPDVELIAWNKPFDQLVAHVHFKLPLQAAGKMHDGLVLAFLLDPHARELGLKPSAERYLNMPPEEQEAVRDWLVRNGVCRDSKTKWGAYIGKAPGSLVGLYANGDTLRTLRLFDELYSRVAALGMLEAYDRELKLQDIMLKASLRGIPVSIERLRQDIEMYDKALLKVDARIFNILGTSPFNISSGAQLADALDKAIPGIDWPRTATGKRSTSKENLEKVLGSLKGELLALLQYRASINTCVNTFMRVWLKQAVSSSDGRIRCTWNTTRSDEAGARTGRLSSTPNFMNIPTLKSAKFTHVVELWEKYLKEFDFPGLPNVRSYIEAPTGYVILKRDFCLAPDTEFLTDSGFKLFDDIDDADKLASWVDGHIVFDEPIRRIDQQYSGNLVSISGEKSFDMLGTEDHKAVIITRNGLLKKVDLIDLPVGAGYVQVPTAGKVTPACQVSDAALTLIAAYQADCKKMSSTRRVVFKASKQRKVDRLKDALNALGVEYTEKFWRYSYDSSKFTWLVFRLPLWVDEFVDTAKKFTRKVIDLPESFLHEVLLWDGSIARSSFFSIHKQNCDILQELACLRGRHTTLRFHKDDTSFNKIGYWILGIHKNGVKYTKTQRREVVPYTGRVVCFEMPKGTLVCRRGCGTFVTGNCGQELRVLAHYEDGPLLAAYKTNPKLDMHQWAADTINSLTGLNLTRKHTKTMAFSIIYGSGLATLAAQMGSTLEEAAIAKSAYLEAVPGIKLLSDGLAGRTAHGKPIRTWGGRLYHVEPPRWDPKRGRMQSFEYKLLNVLIQGGSADITKEAIIAYDNSCTHGEFLLTVHDELVLMVPTEHVAFEMSILKSCMESVPLDCPLESDGEVGANYHEMESYKEAA